MPIFPLIIILALFCVITYYLARRWHQCFNYIFPRIPFLAFVILHSFGILSVVVGFLRSRLPVSSGFKHLLASISAYTMGFYFYLVIFTVFIDILILICRLIKRQKYAPQKLRFISGTVAIILTFATLGYGIIHANGLNLVKYDITVEKPLSGEYKLLLVSDLHLGAVNSESRLEKIVNAINKAEPDIVCIAGDFFDNDYDAIREPDKAVDTLKGIKSKYGVYMCLGNHDAGKEIDKMLEFIELCDITLLNDEYTVINNELTVIGRVNRNSIGGFGGISRKDTSDVMSRVNSNLVTVVMDHDPANADEYGQGTDLILSGHTHNGHTFPGNLINEFNLEFNYGYYQIDENSTQLIVTSGACTWGMPIRVGTDSEIAQITIKSQ